MIDKTNGSTKKKPRRGKVYLVGAGPGDPRLITLRGAQCLRRAEVILFDYLVDPRLLDHAPASAERIVLGRHGSEQYVPPETIQQTMVDRARRGKRVVRLKGGDPVVFGRLAEEIAALREAGIPLEVVPGVTAGLAAAALAEIPITRAGRASAVALVTGHQRGDETDDNIQLDYAALAKFPGTLIFYMGVGTAARWSAELIEQGKSPATPVAIVRRCSWPDQQIVHATLQTLADVVAARDIRPPAVILVGPVVDCPLEEPAARWEEVGA